MKPRYKTFRNSTVSAHSRRPPAAIIRPAVMAGTLIITLGGSTTPAFAASRQATHDSASVTITEMDYYGPPPGNPDLNSVFKAFEKLHPNIKVVRSVYTGADYLTKVEDEAASHTLPDLLMLDNPMVPFIASAGVLTPLASLGHVNPSQFYTPQRAESEYHGVLYAYPPFANTIALIYNKKMLAAAGVTPPTTWSQLEVDAKKLTTTSHFGIVFSGQTGSGQNVWQFEPFLWSNGGSLTNLTSPQSVQALTLWADLVKEGATPPDVVNWGQGQPDSEFAAGKAAMQINGPWNFPGLDAIKGLSYGVVPIPLNKRGQTLVVPIGGEVFTIPRSNSATEHAAFQLLTYMLTPRVDALMSIQNGCTPGSPAALPFWNKLAPPQDLAGYAVMEKELTHGLARTVANNLGTKYPTVETDVGNAIEAALTGKASPQAAFATAQAQVEAVLKG
jgi:multiple sugar transport system substrate-binding protein